MSEEQLSALLAKLMDDAGLQEKLKGAADLDAAIALAKEAGFEVSKADWLNHKQDKTIELSDEELESVTGGGLPDWYYRWMEGGYKVDNGRPLDGEGRRI